MRRSILLVGLLAVGCGEIAWQAADQARRYGTRPLVVPEIEAPAGYRVVRVGLRIVTANAEGGIRTVKLEGAHAPTGATGLGLTFHEGWLYFSHEEKDGTFAISRGESAVMPR